MKGNYHIYRNITFVIVGYLILCLISYMIVLFINTSQIDCYVNHSCGRLAAEDKPGIMEYRQYPIGLFFITSPSNLIFNFPLSIR